MKANIKIKLFSLLLFFCVTLPLLAGPSDPDPDEDGDGIPLDPGAAPINDYIVPMLLLGVSTAFILLRKKHKEA
jgi:hypothetical protein